ncbi:MarR family transcriptional regulator [Virgisporangium ochraceum]|uniref:MarR family transcriptional regulator n=1 Tax=Virgisporangium ochraceum TaxID=65505 RepID=A0A8J4A7Z9_9ACTN|nr:MarR family transcriptional regulator [Virgisporangium ochraceum]GIJ74586.1 MarR family transcriptional regulator [Virgisporangium ochraceum]
MHPSSELVDVLEQALRLLRRLSTAGDLSFTASSTLGRLVREGPMRLTELANAEAASQPGMTQLVTRMEREGLVRREASRDDRRGVVVTVTDAGVDLMNRRRAERTDALRRMFDGLAPADRAAIEAALPALTRLVSP